jgi:hypothetical protein
VAPLIAAKKGSNFTDSDFTLYSKHRKRELGLHDLAPTIAAVLGSEIPRQNQGFLIGEIVELSSYLEDEKKLIFLDHRQQQQNLLMKLGNCICFLNQYLMRKELIMSLTRLQ